jgi:GNAT superfamily N-acetyltransferase
MSNQLILGKFDCSKGAKTELYRLGDLTVRTATSDDQLFIDKLQKENSNALGFIQQTIWEKYVFGGERNFSVFVCEKNDDMVGYVLITPGRGPYSYMRIQQIAVREDARRLDYGTALMTVVKEFANKFNLMGARLRCRTDLQSNHFWKALGFIQYGVWKKGMENHVGFKASQDINLWQIDLNDSLITLFETTELENGLWVPKGKASNLAAR